MNVWQQGMSSDEEWDGFGEGAEEPREEAAAAGGSGPECVVERTGADDDEELEGLGVADIGAANR